MPAGKRVYLEAASAVSVSKDGKTYTFTIRPNQKASNGKAVTGQWFVRAFERALSPKMGDAAAARAGADSIVGPIVVGAHAFYDGKASKITGLSVKGNKLTIKLLKPFPCPRERAGDELVHRDRSRHPVQRAGLLREVGHGRAVLHLGA